MFLKVFVSYSSVSFRKACILVSYENMESLRDHFSRSVFTGKQGQAKGNFLSDPFPPFQTSDN